MDEVNMKVVKVIMTGSKNVWTIENDDGSKVFKTYYPGYETFTLWPTKKDAKLILEAIKSHSLEYVKGKIYNE
jgi:hypothetical protein